jgi:hypothetical protein
MYKQIKTPQGEISNSMILRVADNAFIPFDEANTDYQAYLAWVEAGGQVLPADEGVA